MGEYSTFVDVDFKGTDDEKKKFWKLFELMNKEGCPARKAMDALKEGIFIQTAFLGKLSDFGTDSKRYTRYFPDFDFSLPARTIAAIIPGAQFLIVWAWEYSVGGGLTHYEAEYKNGRLRVRSCQTEEDLESMDLSEDDYEKFGDLDEDELISMLLEKCSWNGWRDVKIERDPEYEKSFCDGRSLDELLAQPLEGNG